MLWDYLSFFRAVTPEWQQRRILGLIENACEHVPFYRDLLKKQGLSPSDFSNVEDFIEKFPRTHASAYRSIQQDKGHAWMVDERCDLERMAQDRSSGSSGIPISVYRTRKENAYHKASVLWHLTKAGVRPWHRLLAVVPPLQQVKRDSFIQLFGIFRRYTVHYLMKLDDVLDFIDRNKINVMYGQKSFMLLLAERYVETGRTPPKLACLVPAAERIDKASRHILCHTFHPKYYAEIYGSTEAGITASMHGGDYEVNYRSNFFCLTNPVSAGDLTRGSIAVTSLYQHAQPFLMLELGDEVCVRHYDKLLDLKATIASIDGRDNDFLHLENGERISGATFYGALEYFPFMRQFRILQDEIGSCRVLLRLTEDTTENRNEVEQVLASILAEKIRYEVEYVDAIPIDPNGKTKILISNVQR